VRVASLGATPCRFVVRPCCADPSFFNRTNRSLAAIRLRLPLVSPFRVAKGTGSMQRLVAEGLTVAVLAVDQRLAGLGWPALVLRRPGRYHMGRHARSRTVCGDGVCACSVDAVPRWS